jgi:Bacterial Ig-like domain
MRVRFPLVLAASAVLVVACGDDREGDSTAPADSTAPHVESVSPSGGLRATDVITVTFDEAVDAASVTPDSVSVGAIQASRTVAGSVVILAPAGGAWPSVPSITVVVTSAVRDLAGNAAGPWSAVVSRSTP